MKNKKSDDGKRSSTYYYSSTKVKSGQIGYCENKDLPGLEKIPGGHYVYIQEIDKTKNLCSVNVITSLESRPENYSLNKIRQVRKGNTYPIPVYDTNLSKWSGVTRKPIKNVRVENIKNIGIKTIKRRHQFYIGKYCK